jgi:hypothetical protein
VDESKVKINEVGGGRRVWQVVGRGKNIMYGVAKWGRRGEGGELWETFEIPFAFSLRVAIYTW